jgi:hypothetical protein
MCSSKHHGKHLCSQNNEGEFLSPCTVIVECAICGGRAGDPGDVCDPITLPGAEWMGDGADVVY